VDLRYDAVGLFLTAICYLAPGSVDV